MLETEKKRFLHETRIFVLTVISNGLHLVQIPSRIAKLTTIRADTNTATSIAVRSGQWSEGD